MGPWDHKISLINLRVIGILMTGTLSQLLAQTLPLVLVSVRSHWGFADGFFLEFNNKNLDTVSPFNPRLTDALNS